LTLEYVHGYRGHDCSSNVFYTASDEAAYFTASVAVVMDPATRDQRHYTGPGSHVMREIYAMAIHPSGTIAATAERAADPSIFIWDLASMATLRTLSGCHRGGVSALAFSPDGRRLYSAGMEAGRFVAAWDWKNDRRHDPLCKQELKTERVFALSAHPKEELLVACGVNCIAFLRLGLSRSGARTFECLPGAYSSANRGAGSGRPPTQLCCAFTRSEYAFSSTLRNQAEGLCLAGSDNGNIYLWKKHQQVRARVPAARPGATIRSLHRPNPPCTPL
jgi:WD40 repeat protein